MADLKLPDNFTRLTAKQFRDKYGEVAKALYFHVAGKTRPQASTSAAVFQRLGKVEGMLTRMERDGKLAFASAPNGDPSVFTASRKTLSAEEIPYAEAVVSYFDSTGSFNQETGEVEDYEAKLAVVQADIAEIEKEIADKTSTLHGLLDRFEQGLPAEDRRALAILCEAIDAEPRKVLETYAGAVQEFPDAKLTLETFVKQGAAVYAKHWNEQHPEEPMDTGFLNKIAETYNKALIARVLLLRGQFEAHPYAKGLPFGQQAALAFLADRMALTPETLIQAFADWRVRHPTADGGDFFNDFVTDTRQQQEVSEEYAWFRDHLHEYVNLEAEQFAHQLVEEADRQRAALNLAFEQLRPFSDKAASGVPLSPDEAPEVRAAVEEAKVLRRNADAMSAFLTLLGDPANFPFLLGLSEYAQTRGIPPQALVGSWVAASTAQPGVSLGQFLQLLDAKTPQPGDPVYNVPEATLDEWIAEEYPDAVERLSRACSISKRVVREVLDRWVNAGVLKFARVKAGEKTRISGVLPHGWPELIDASRSERLIKDEFSRQFHVMNPRVMNAKAGKLGLEVRPLEEDSLHLGPAGFHEALETKLATLAPRGIGSKVEGTRPGEHTYMRAIEAQYGALTDMIYMANKARTGGLPPELLKYRISVEELFDDDIPALKRAETFCWFEEPMRAVEASSQALPDNARLTREMTEHYAGWWYFTMPPEIKTGDDVEAVQALLWSWQDERVLFSTYVRDEHATPLSAGAALFPTAKFYWVEGETLAHMLQRCRAEIGGRPLVGEMTADETLAAIEQLARFFIAGSLWIQQPIIVQSKGHIERHARKRMEKAAVFERPLSDVQIIQLRRRESVSPVKSDQPQARDWKCRWVVGGLTGFWRNQYYPSEGRYKLKLILPFVKGPADKPLKIPSHRVYAVSR